MQAAQVSITEPPQNSVFFEEFSKIRRIILGLTVTLIFTYLPILIAFDLGAQSVLKYSMPILAFYNLMECIWFFGCSQYNFTLVLTCRTIFLLHDLSYFILYCIWGNKGGFYIGCIVFLAVAVCLNITIMALYGKLPRKHNFSCCPL